MKVDVDDLVRDNPTTGFAAGVYHDYISGKNIVFPDPSTWTAVHYRTFLERAVNCWDNSSMMVRVDPNANDGIVKVYMRLKAGIDHSGHTHTAITHPEDPSYRLFYRTDVDRDGKRISLPAETRVHLQSHWGSGVKFTGIEIRPLER